METEPPPASAAPPPPVPTSPKPPAPPAEAAEPALEITTTPAAAVEAPAAAPAAAAEAVAEPKPAAVNPYEPQPEAAAAAAAEAEGAGGEEAVIVEEQAEDPDDNSEDDGIAGAFKSKVKEPTRYAHKDGAALRATKREVMEGVNAFEAKRVAYFKSQTSTNVRYWTALKEMAGESKAEAERLVGWFNGRLAAQRAYACALLDVNDETAGIKKGATRTALFGKSASTTQLSFSSRRGSSGALGQLPTGTVIKGAVGAAGGNGELQDELCGMDVTQAQEIMELIVLLEGTTGAELKKGHIDISTQVEMVITEGNDFLVSLDALGLYVDNEYDTLRQAAAVTLDEDPLSHGKKAAAAAAKVAEVDFWLLDARYRVAVRQQRSAWSAAEGIMAGLFGRLRDLELARRACTKKAIDELFLKQTELTGKPLTAQPFVAACLARVALTPEALDKHIKEEAARKATSSIAAAPAAAAEEGAPVPPPPAPEPDAPTDMGFMDHLVASLDSPLVLASEVLERKAKSMTSRSFVTTLVVLTADHHLHMFDVKGKAPGSSAKAAFDSLIPLIDACARPNKTPKKYTIAPSATLDVSAFTAGKRGKQTKLVHASQFHVVEVKANSGVKHFFKKESLSKASLRARSEANCEEWLQRLYALCEPAAGEA